MIELFPYGPFIMRSLNTMFGVMATAIASVVPLPGAAAQVQCPSGWRVIQDPVGLNARVRAIAQLSNGDIIAGGSFGRAGSVQVLSVGRYNRTTNSWQQLGGGLYGGSDGVFALHVLPNGDVLAGGDFFISRSTQQFSVPRLARYNNSSNAWAATGPMFTGVVKVLYRLSDGRVVVGGTFASIGSVRYNNVGLYDPATNQLSPLGSGIASSLNGTTVDAILELPDGDIVAGGKFFAVPGTTDGHLARFRPSTQTWTTVPSSISVPTNSAEGVRFISRQPDGRLLLGGDIFATSSSLRYIFNTDPNSGATSEFGGAFNAPGRPSSWAMSMAVLPNGNYAFGCFSSSGSSNRLAQYSLDTNTWSSIGDGDANGTVQAMHVAQTDTGQELVVGGIFNRVGAIGAGRIARLPLSGPGAGVWEAVGMGLDGVVQSVSLDRQGRTLIAGNFTSVGGVRANGVARYDGTRWTSFGTGIEAPELVYGLVELPNGNIVAFGSNLRLPGQQGIGGLSIWDGASWSLIGRDVVGGSVTSGALTSSGQLVVGGCFGTSGNAIRGVAIWDGQSWLPLGSGLPGCVSAITVAPNGTIVAAGLFSSLDTPALNNIARWDGSSWQSLATGVQGRVRALAVLPNGDLVAGGLITSASGTTVQNIARWDGTAWHPMGQGSLTEVTSLVVRPGGDVIAAGSFEVGTGNPTTRRVARWNGTTWQELAPEPLAGQARSLAILPSGNLLVGGAEFSSTPEPGLFGYLHEFVFPGSCVADFDCSGVPVTVSDLWAFVDAWFSSNARADVNTNGVVTVQDLFEFLNAWFAGC